ncbi:MAG: radical SAM protein [Candidatus Heimdallarchaeota archaeon]|nr:radical SAM protein [Candidatus Heimdallarchaeota archaeon]MCK4769733.1 radical SAM protein [Candidatus Heimdallarchaeota archaeon]
MSKSSSGCSMIEQGFPQGSCLVETVEGKTKLACKSTLRYSQRSGYERVIKSHHLSRPEDYFSIYQSGCNHTCLKCHSHDFSKVVNGKWMSSDEIAKAAIDYSKHITVYEPREAATSWHAHRLCRHCGSCVLYGVQSENCPKKLKPEQVVFSPQGFGPARNIAAFTGGDVMCKPEFYLEVTKKIKKELDDFWILLETNGYGLTPQNLEAYAAGGIDAFWLDIKAYSEDVYGKLCGTTNEHIIESVQRIIDLGFTLEILTLYIPFFVETDEHEKIAELISNVDPKIPTTLLAFFPCYKLNQPIYRPPRKEEIVESITRMKEIGLKNLRIGNLGTFIKDSNDLQYLEEKLGSGFY